MKDTGKEKCEERNLLKARKGLFLFFFFKLILKWAGHRGKLLSSSSMLLEFSKHTLSPDCDWEGAHTSLTSVVMQVY